MRHELLFVTQVAPYRDGPAGVHGVLDQAVVAMRQIGALNGMKTKHVPDVHDISPGELLDAQVLALFTIGETPWTEQQKQAIVEHVRAGRLAICSIHSATDACYTWPAYGDLVGARFNGHPWTQEFTADVLDQEHPACAHLGDAWTWRDEVYQFRDLRDDAQVLLRVRDGELDMDAPGANAPEFGFPLAWTFREGKGRVFSTSLGHFPGAWESPVYLQHLSGGLKSVLTG